MFVNHDRWQVCGKALLYDISGVPARKIFAGVINQHVQFRAFRGDGKGARFDVRQFHKAVDLDPHYVGLMIDDPQQLQ